MLMWLVYINEIFHFFLILKNKMVLIFAVVSRMDKFSKMKKVLYLDEKNAEFPEPVTDISPLNRVVTLA